MNYSDMHNYTQTKVKKIGQYAPAISMKKSTLIQFFFYVCLNHAFCIAPYMRGVSTFYFSTFSIKTFVVGTLSNEYHNICFHGEVRKISVLFG